MTIAYKIGALLPMLASTMTVDEIARLTSMLRTLAIVAFAIGALALIGSVVIWIKLDIKNVIGFLSGKNAAKAIEALLTGKQAYKGKSKGVRPSEPTGRPSAGANVGYDPGLTTPLQDADRTELLDKNDLDNDERAVSKTNKEIEDLIDDLNRFIGTAAAAPINAKLEALREPNQGCDSDLVNARHFIDKEINYLKKGLDDYEGSQGSW